MHFFSKMKLLLLLIGSCLSSAVLAQDFVRIPYDTLELQTDAAGFNILDAYLVEGFEYHIRSKDIDDSTSYVLRMMVYDQQGELVFRSPALQESYVHRLSFYKSPRFPDKTIILGFNRINHSLGSDVYLLEAGKIRYLGLFDAGTYAEGDIAWDIANYIDIQSDGKEFVFQVNYDQLMFNPGGEREKILGRNQLKYSFRDGVWLEEVLHE
jgi:hypothetical protein